MVEVFNMQYTKLIRENQLEIERPFVFPPRRWPKNSRGKKFISENEITSVTSLKFLRNSPFVKNNKDLSTINTETQKEIIYNLIHRQLYAIGVTPEGLHVMLERNIHTSYITCIIMLLLDQNFKFDDEFKRMSKNEDQREIRMWLLNFKLKLTYTSLKNKKKDEILTILKTSINRYGPAILSVNSQSIGSHYIIIDNIIDLTAHIRDPYHGWAISIHILTLLSWIDNNGYFMQLAFSN